MSFDLPTILVLRLGVDLTVSAGLWMQARRHPSVGGPGWWALAGLCSTLGTLGLALRLYAPGPLMAGVTNGVLGMGVLFVWMGLRSHLRLFRPIRWVVVACVGILVANVLLDLTSASLTPRQALFALIGVVVRIAMLRDMRWAERRQPSPELRALKWFTWIELVMLVGVGVAVWFDHRGDAVRFGLYVPMLLVYFMLDMLARMVICFLLVTAQLQQEGNRARQAVVAREQESRALVDNLGAGVMVLRPDQTLISINAAARRFLGWAPAGIQPATTEPLAPDWTLLREDGQPMRRHELPFERVLATAQPVNDVVIGAQTSAGGTQRQWALCNAYPENDALGALRHVVLTFVDITTLKEAQQEQQALEQKLAKSRKMEALGTLAGGVAHDFNNILAAILGNADLARQDVPGDSRARESLHQISGAARRGRELVRQVQAFSRQQPMERTAVDVAAVVAECCGLLRAASSPQVELVQTCAPGLSPVLADATQLGQVLLNLGTNAVHALDEGAGRIEFQVDQMPAHAVHLSDDALGVVNGRDANAMLVRIQVRDNGCGMDEVTRSRMFEPFFTTRTLGRGTGLGLPVVLGVVEAHGGAIEVHSEQGRGTHFTMYFPAMVTPASVPEGAPAGTGSDPDGAEGGTMAVETCSDAGAPNSPPSVEISVMADVAASDPPHILYLDDDDTLVFLVRRLLERRGYRVTAVCDQQQAIDAVREQPEAFNLLMTDYNMPGMSGLDVAKAVLAINPQLPVAVASGYITDELQAEAMAAGVREVVFKTDAVEAFCEVVARLAK